MIHKRSTTTPQEAGAPSNTEQPPARCPTQDLGASSRGPRRQRQRPSQVTHGPRCARSTGCSVGSGRAPRGLTGARVPLRRDLTPSPGQLYKTRAGGMSRTHQGAKQPGDPGRNGGGHPHNPTPTSPNRQQLSSVPESGRKACVCVCICEYVCVFKRRVGRENDNSTANTKSSSNGLVYLGKYCPQPHQETLKAQVRQLQECAQAWHTPTHVYKCFLWHWPPQKTITKTCQ